MILEVKVVPHSQNNQVVGWEASVLRIKVRGVPEDNQVNTNLIQFLSEFWEIPKSALYIVSGSSSRLKRIGIEESYAEKVRSKLMLIA